MTQGSSSTLGGNMEILITIMIATALLIATITDLRSQKIYNWLTFPLMFSGLLAHTVFGGLDGLGLSAGGFALGLGVMIVPFFMGMMGAGDVKLMTGIGAWLGASATLTAFLITCIAGGFYAIIVLFKYRDHMKNIFANIWNSFLMIVTTQKFEYTPVASEEALPRLCYGVAIAIGTVTAMSLNFMETGSVLAR